MTAATLHHLTLNTGHAADIPRADIPEAEIDRYIPIIDKEEGRIPELAGRWYVDLTCPRNASGTRRDGAAFFQIADQASMSKTPIILGMVCWRETMAAEAWEQVTLSYDALADPMRQADLWQPPPASIPAVPWLAVWFTPWLITAAPDDVLAFARVEQALAWALIR
jgi:hypothetical protein